MNDYSADETSTRKTCERASEAKIRIRRTINLNFVVEKQQLQVCHCTDVKQNQPQLVAARFPRHVYNRNSASSEKNCKRAKEKRQSCEMKSRILKLKSMSRIPGRASRTVDIFDARETNRSLPITVAPEGSASQNETLTTKGIPGKDKVGPPFNLHLLTLATSRRTSRRATVTPNPKEREALQSRGHATLHLHLKDRS